MRTDRIEWEERLLADEELLRHIADKIKGPFHVIYPDQVVENIRAFQKVFANSEVKGRIYYGKKANKSACVVAACAEAGVGIDVASVDELTTAEAGGIRGPDLMVTGPHKSDELLTRAAKAGALIAVDSLGELARLSELSRRADSNAPARIVMRVLPPSSSSRFGMTAEELDAALPRVEAMLVRLEGFSFHLGGYEAAPRAELARALVERCLDAREAGHPADTISIGGGFGVNYVSAAAWNTFSRSVNALWFQGGRIPRGESYPYHCAAPGPEMLKNILSHGSLGNILREKHIRLAIEPGRALLDRAGSTVFRVQGRKTRVAHGLPYDILTVDGTSFSLSEQWFDSEYLPDPVLWPERAGAETPTCVGGASCLESDMLSWRRIPLPRAAEVDDLLVYPNTAGYQMDSNESRFHGLPIPPKIVLRDKKDGRQFTWACEKDPHGPEICQHCSSTHPALHPS
ncbi:alanine racemase [Nocardia sp. NPDC046763]|uniref:alanine racemase n=1 Tax=Nocardia sp. NPDC046763 TaxID=3155256 RepID=UPI0033E1C47D